MQQEQPSSPSAARVWWHEVSIPARAAFVCAIPIAFGLVIWDALDDSLGPEHPLSTIRLGLRLGCFFACGVSLTIAGIGTFRAWRWTTRLQKGLCPKCGYDLRASHERCPECGQPAPEKYRP